MPHEKIYAYRCDYIDRHGHYIELTHPTLLQTSALDPTEWRMIDENKLPGHLPIQMEEHNLSLKLLFRFTGMRKLSQQLELSPLSLKQFYDLLMSIVNVVDTAKSFMLTEERFVLLPDYIFVSPHDEQQIQLMYLPMTNVEKPSLQQELTDLIVFLVGYIRDLHGNGVQALLQQLRADTFTLQTFKRKLTSLIEMPEEDFAPMEQNSVEQDLIELEHLTPEYESLHETEKREANLQVPPVSIDEVNAASETDQLEMYGGSEEERINLSSPKAATKEKDPFKFTYLLTSVALVMLLAIIWRIYFAFASEKILYICLAGSIAALAAAALFIRWQKNKIEQRTETWTPPYDPSVLLEEVTSEVEDHYYAKLGDRTTLLNASNISEQRLDDQVDDRTEMLSRGDLTEILSPSDLQQPIESLPIQQLVHIDPERSITLHEGSHRIGRDAEHVSIVLQYKGVSRLHCELTVGKTSSEIKDLGSSNGTTINNTPLVPYKPYVLSDGDEIQIGHERYTYQMR